MTNDEVYTPEENKKESKIIANKLLDKSNPEMITQVLASEVNLLSDIWTIGEDINRARIDIFGKDCQNSIMYERFNKNMVVRTSIKGWRANQIESILSKQIEEEKIEEKNSGLFGLGGKIIKRSSRV